MSSGFAVIVAADEARGIGRGADLPWRLPGEMAYFKRVTSEAPQGKRNAVVMGRKTYESIPQKFRPLPYRHNVVLSRGALALPAGVTLASSLDEALAVTARMDDIAQVFVIGGGSVYEAALEHPACSRILLTQIHASFACDTFLPALGDAFQRVHSEGPHEEQGLSYTFEIYERRTRGASE